MSLSLFLYALCISAAWSTRYLIQAGGYVNKNYYPYRNTETRPCQFDQSRAIAKLADCRSYSLTSQERLKQLLYTTGPISISIKSSGIENYNVGLITDEMCNVGVVNHAVLLVGYGTDAKGVPIWIGKNSWGTQWGEQGFFRMVRGENPASCGMMNDAMLSSIIV